MVEPWPETLRSPPSPCTKVCTLDARGYCIGCGRTGEEIGRWLSMTPAQQWDLIAELEQRKASQPPRAPEPAQACGGAAPDADDDES